MSSPLQEIMCCLGPSLAGNPTQYVMEKCFHHLGWDRRFLSLQVAVENLPAAVAGMQAMQFRGAVVTSPFQVGVMECLDHLDMDAQQVGAANCLYLDQDRKWVGGNTIGSGFVRGLRTVCEPSGKHVLILGAGLTAKAIALALTKESVSQITVACHEEDAGKALIALVEKAAEISTKLVPWEGPIAVEQDVNLVVHAAETSNIESTEAVSLVEESLHTDMLLIDKCLGSPTTALLRMGTNRGCTTLGGQQIQVNEWAECVRLWTGSEPDIDIMREALEEYMGL